MEYVTIKEQHLEDIGDAIRTLTNGDTTYRPKDMAAAINAVAANPDINPDNKEWVYSEGTVDPLNSGYQNYESNGGNMYGFKGLQGLTDLTLTNCINLHEIDLTEVDYKPSFFFGGLQNCPHLTTIKLPDYEDHNNYASWSLGLESSNYEKIKVSDAIIAVYPGVFSGCLSLKELTLPTSTEIYDENVFKNSFIEKIYFLGKPHGGYFKYIRTPFENWKDSYTGALIIDTWPDRVGTSSLGSIDYPLSPFCRAEHLTDIYVPWSQGEVLDREGNDVLEEDRNLINRGVTVHYNWRY